MLTYAIDFVLGGQKHVLCVKAEDRDDAFDKAREQLRQAKLISFSLQGSPRPATDDEIERSWTPS